MRRGPLIVTFDRGAASPAEIVTGLSGLGPVVFMVRRSAHSDRLAEVIGRLAPTLPVTGDPAADAAALRALDPAAILTFSEPMLPVTAALAEELGLPFHSVDATRRLTDKTAQRRRLRECGVDDVRSRPLSALGEWPAVRAAVGLPAVLKPVLGQGSRDTHLVTDDAAARAVLTRLLAEPGATVVAEEYLVGRPSGRYGDYVSVESCRGPNGIRHLAVTGKLPLAPPFRETGRFWPATLTTAERSAVTGLVDRALTALEVGPGLTHSEVKLTAGGPRLIEVNGRLGGHVNGLARQVAGQDLIRLAGLGALGREPDPPPALDLPGRVHFQHNTLAPIAACELVALHGGERVRRHPAVRGFRPYFRPGALFEPDVATRHLDLLWGDSSDHDGMLAALEEAREFLAYEFRFADGVRQLSVEALRKGVVA